MPGSHWMIVLSPENFEITRSRGFDMLGLKSRHRKKAERMAIGDRVLFYVAGLQIFPTTATVSSTFFEDHTPIWVSNDRRTDVAPWRVNLRPDMGLKPYEYLDARQIAPRMLYVKRWAPEDWPLAFQGQVHLLSSQDFSLIEHEMRRTADRRSRRREQPPRRPTSVGASLSRPGLLMPNGVMVPGLSSGVQHHPPVVVEQVTEVFASVTITRVEHFETDE